MNTTSTLVAVAGVAVFVIICGFLVFGNQQSPGPLSGNIGPTSTTLTLSVSNCTISARDGGYLDYTVSGKLRDSSGNPVAGRNIDLQRISCDNTACAAELGRAITGPDGNFTIEKHEPPISNLTIEYGASFSGDSVYSGSSSNRVNRLC